jgi:chaperone modulatory protein CbpM
MNERELLERAHLDRATFEICIEQQWLAPRRAGAEQDFADIDLARASLIHDLKHKMNVNDEGLDIILHLLDQMHGLRRALAEALASLRERDRSGGNAPSGSG